MCPQGRRWFMYYDATGPQTKFVGCPVGLQKQREEHYAQIETLSRIFFVLQVITEMIALLSFVNVFVGLQKKTPFCIAKVTGCVKFDLQAEPDAIKEKIETGGNVQGIYDLRPGRYGSEAIFVPKQPEV
nr:carotenoid cleavage dioxygenase 1 [Tanacetum cinerariifolium]